MEPTQEEIFANDKDPMEALAEIERAEASSEGSTESSQEEIGGGAPESNPESQNEELDDAEYVDTPDDGFETSADNDTTDPVEPEGETTEEDGTRTFTANGQKFSFTQEEINAQFEGVFGKAMDYTQKMQKISPYRKMISALETEGVSQEDLNVALDALKGNKGALAELLERNKVDAFDLDSDNSENPYQATEYGKTEFQEEMESITQDLSADAEYAITVDVIDQQWDEGSRNILADNPKMIRGLHADIKNGVYDKVAPLAMKMKVLDGNTKSDIEYYILAGEQAYSGEGAPAQPNQNTATQTQDAGQKFDKASSEADKRRAASSTRARADRKGVIDYLDDDDAAYEEWHRNLMNSQ